MNQRPSRLTLGVAIPAAAFLVGFVPYLTYRSELSDRLASHFDGSGSPDGSMTVTGFVIATSVLMAIGSALCVGLAVTRRPLADVVGSVSGFLGGFLAGLGAAILGGGVMSQRGIEQWQDASSPWLTVLTALLLATTLGAAGAMAASHLPQVQFRPDPGAVPTMPLEPGEHAVWTGTLHSRWLLYLGIGSLVLGVLAAAGTFWWLALPAIVSAVAVSSLATLRVTADRNGLTVRYGWLPWPRTTVGTERIKTASVIDVKPMQWGGWGYRGSLKLMRKAAVVHRAGPGIRLDLNDGRVFVVTVDDPDVPVALLNTEAGRQQLAT